mmetsp:Transcript_23013/g.26392  ORF Transcript_23013/g.26392 Transcript_23013/m.26392 type:complete len:189 (-) Transcript_23013:17-583(-)|eukprot:CAMPEP_0168344436 /NCGR_PEP_ID=MMETSP0213-20121227/16817_1 /TAXON_ID=151035 /ORGANISM="Euplotes harpa, Strain FSP1.4" /LENGTH=188 /DNA_ID=CAMNT_0008352181 /DNA_START=365 /DNA_END=931 /DNA_ORIENTATION=-
MNKELMNSSHSANKEESLYNSFSKLISHYDEVKAELTYGEEKIFALDGTQPTFELKSLFISTVESNFVTMAIDCIKVVESQEKAQKLLLGLKKVSSEIQDSNRHSEDKKINSKCTEMKSRIDNEIKRRENVSNQDPQAINASKSQNYARSHRGTLANKESDTEDLDQSLESSMRSDFSANENSQFETE